MWVFLHGNLEHVLCVLLLISRLGDIFSTLLVTPSLRLEANPLARKLGRPFMVLTVLVCLVPYYSKEMAVALLAPFLLVSASNISKLWFVRAFGEAEYVKLLMRLARKSKLSHMLVPLFGHALFTVLAGAVLIFLSQEPGNVLSAHFGLGIIIYAFVISLHGSFFYRRLFLLARQANAVPEPDGPTSA